MTPGNTVGSYQLERELARGGMGAVYAGVHQLLGRRAAVKVLLPELSNQKEQIDRFFNEARAASAIKHPSIVEIYDFGYADDGRAFIVMELLEGQTLAQRLERGPLSPRLAVTFARQIATALGAAHDAGIIHRDLKPDNIFLELDPEITGGERVKLLDFGIAKLTQPSEAGLARTMTGALLGTPHYMSPEQCEGSRVVDHRSDLYALGCVLFQMIAGRRPFEGEGVGGLIGMHLHVPPPKLRTRIPHAPVELEALVDRLLAKSPDERPQTAEETAQALGELDELLAAVPPAPCGTIDTLAPTLAVQREATTVATEVRDVRTADTVQTRGPASPRPSPEPVPPAERSDALRTMIPAPAPLQPAVSDADRPTRRRAFRLLAAMFGGSLVVVLAFVVFRRTDTADRQAEPSVGDTGRGRLANPDEKDTRIEPPPRDAGPGKPDGHTTQPMRGLDQLLAAGEFQRVVDICVKTGTLKIDMNRACTIAACEVGDRAHAEDWSRVFRGKMRRQVAKRCRDRGIVLDPPEQPPNAAE